MKRAIYAGTFDPFTYGHQHIIEKALTVFDEVIVAVAHNPGKRTLFDVEERRTQVVDSLKSFPNIRVVVIDNEYVADYAAENNIAFLVRRLRDGGDMEFERKLYCGNRLVQSGVESVFLMCDHEMQLISSSAIQQWVGPRGWVKHVRNMVPPPVLRALITKSMEKRWMAWTEKLGISSNLAAERFVDLRAQYEGRPFHNLLHVLRMLEAVESGLYPVEDSASVTLAVWYHDYIVESDDKGMKSDRSAEVRSAERVASDPVWKSMTPRVADLIKATQHTAEAQLRTSDEKIIVGVDLLTLALDEPLYQEYVECLRQEYGWASEADFNKGRAAFLRQMLAKPRLFPGMSCFQRDELKARDNMQSELDRRESKGR